MDENSLQSGHSDSEEDDEDEQSQEEQELKKKKRRRKNRRKKKAALIDEFGDIDVKMGTTYTLPNYQVINLTVDSHESDYFKCLSQFSDEEFNMLAL